MFNNDDILVLAKAGFNAQQIAALSMVGPQPQPQPIPETKPQPIPETKPQPIPETKPQPQPIPETKPEPAPQGASIDDVLKSVEGLTKTFQNGFMMSAQQPQPVTAEDILAKIINPPTDK